MDRLNLLNGLRFLDSFFPSGGFAYSSGLEAAVQGGAVRTGKDLSRYVEDWLRGGLARREAVAAWLAHEAVTSKRLETALRADRELDAMKLDRESRLASRQMGRQVARIAADQMEGCPVLRRYQAALDWGTTAGHLPVAFGLVLAACGWNRQEAVAGYLYHAVVGLASAAMKLLPVGQRESQRLLQEWTEVIVSLNRSAAGPERMSSWTPVQDIYAMRHARLESRLFRS